jgi:Type II secretion system (T2SS), protein E, N-terminal domain
MPGGRRGFLSDVIVELGMVDSATVDRAVNAARTPGLKVERLLVESGALTEDQLARATAERYGLDHVDLNEFEIQHAAANLIEPGVANRYQAVPVSFTDDGSLVLAMSDPSDALGLNDIAVMTKLAVLPVVASKPAIQALRERLPLPPTPGQGPPPMQVGAPQGQGERTNGASAEVKPSPVPAEAEPTAVFWQPDGEGAPAREPESAPDGADAAELRTRLETEHQRALEELKEEYEAKIRGHEKDKAGLDQARAEAEQRASELETRVRELEHRAQRADGEEPAERVDAAEHDRETSSSQMER